MRHTALVASIVALALLGACDRTPPAAPANVATPAPVDAAATPAAPVAAPAISGFGPQTTTPGVAVNAQKDGNSAIWIKATGNMFVPGTIVTFDGHQITDLNISPNGDVLTMVIPTEYIQTAGIKHIAVRPGGTGAEVAVGDFEVTQ